VFKETVHSQDILVAECSKILRNLEEVLINAHRTVLPKVLEKKKHQKLKNPQNNEEKTKFKFLKNKIKTETIEDFLSDDEIKE
jgi:hypothetical protein